DRQFFCIAPIHGTRSSARPDKRVELEQFFRDGLVTHWHQSGTAKMGRDSMSVIDGQLKVYGIDGLRITDASILPRVTTGNTMAPCLIIGERAAELRRDATRLESVQTHSAVFIGGKS